MATAATNAPFVSVALVLIAFAPAAKAMATATPTRGRAKNSAILDIAKVYRDLATLLGMTAQPARRRRAPSASPPRYRFRGGRCGSFFAAARRRLSSPYPRGYS